MARADNSLYGTFIRVLKKVGPKKKFATLGLPSLLVVRPREDSNRTVSCDVLSEKQREAYCLFPISVNFENDQYLCCFLDFRDHLGIVRNR